MRGRHDSEDGFVDFIGTGLGSTQSFSPGSGDLHGVGAAVVAGAAALKVALRHQPRHEIGKRGTVDAGELHQKRLADTIVLLDGVEHGELALGQAGFADLFHINVGGILRGALQQMVG